MASEGEAAFRIEFGCGVVFSDAIDEGGDGCAAVHAAALILSLMRTLAMFKRDGTVVVDQPAQETDQDRLQGRQPRLLSDVPDGHCRSITIDIRRNPIADRSALGVTCFGMKSAESDAADDNSDRRPYPQIAKSYSRCQTHSHLFADACAPQRTGRKSL